MSDGDRSLRIHRFRVARSGLVHGRSNDALETLGDGEYGKAKNVSSNILAATATRSPDDRFLSMCFFSFEFDYNDVNKVDPPVPLQLDMDLVVGDESERSNKGIAMSRLPDLPAKVGLMPTCPISAAGELWAPYLTSFHGPSKFVMQRLDKDAGRWVEVAAVDVPLPPQSTSFREDSIPVIQGFAVVGHTILLSLYPYHLFFTFDCFTSWAPVVTNNNEKHNYMPIRKRGVYVEEDDIIYCLCGGCVVYAYKLICIDKTGQYRMAAPTIVDRVYPTHNEGSGFLAHLGGRVMCFVWIGLRLRCSCDDTKHVLVTTFRIKGDDDRGRFIPKGVEVLHSTCRRLLGILPRKTCGCYYEFSFLQ
ncbi:hypothetical protein QOZ80_6BG0469070 [Eleusine coracana subsp. coracana]|nr:hypothetical protein QOZ80_6BG0469070 [Eleusine coracana subsp. coracana]